jgi:hypothetical protein
MVFNIKTGKDDLKLKLLDSIVAMTDDPVVPTPAPTPGPTPDPGQTEPPVCSSQDWSADLQSFNKKTLNDGKLE